MLSDIRFFLLHRPDRPTLIRFRSVADRQDYSQRILQRLGVGVNLYAILNIHQIGIEVPVRYVFEELLKWSGDSTCWPNHIARVVRVDDRLESIRVFAFGRTRYPPGFKNGLFGLKFIPLFNLNAIRFQRSPDPLDLDNARYLLYECSGGYPIGVFSMYVRSPIATQNEVERTQLFLIVGFNFYGHEEWSNRKPVNWAWESIHNRVTSNVMNRFKQLCEWRFEKIKQADSWRATQ